jgi:hypothetical protein
MDDLQRAARHHHEADVKRRHHARESKFSYHNCTYDNHDYADSNEPASAFLRWVGKPFERKILRGAGHPGYLSPIFDKLIADSRLKHCGNLRSVLADMRLSGKLRIDRNLWLPQIEVSRHSAGLATAIAECLRLPFSIGEKS